MTIEDTSNHQDNRFASDVLHLSFPRDPLTAFDLGSVLSDPAVPPESKTAEFTPDADSEAQAAKSAEHTDHEVGSGAVLPQTASALPSAGAHTTGAPHDHAFGATSPHPVTHSTVAAPPPYSAAPPLGGSIQPPAAETLKTATLGTPTTSAHEPVAPVASQTSISPVAQAAPAAIVPPGPAPTSNQLNDVTFECGVDASGNVASPAFADYVNGTEPAQYDTTNDFASKWFNDASGNTIGGKDANGNLIPASSTAGTGGGTVTYSFTQNVGAVQQAAFKSALTLWSDEANIQFAEVPSTTASSSVDITFDVTQTGGSFATSAPQFLSTVGSNQISSRNPGGSITFNNGGSFGTIGSYSASGGYAVGATIHEIGHAIGLGHAGPYNDGSNKSDPTADQFNEYDSRQWSVMSYISPSATAAKFFGQYTVTGTQNLSQDGFQVAPQTPMFDDILSAQRLYGLSTSTTFSGGQTFGFNCNIADSAESFFDFTKNVNPFVTLYDTGTGNTLDCSGFSTNCTINLNPGTFSTAASYTTLTNNIGIAYGTKIDTGIGGSGDDIFTVNADNDTIDGGGGTNIAVFSGARANYTIAPVATTTKTLVTNNTTGAADTLSNIQALQFSDQNVSLCFASGSLIRTVRGDMAVEALSVGDLVVTSSGAQRPIKWLGHRTVDCRSHPRLNEALPVRIAAHAFGPNRPQHDLYVSPGHSICVDVVGEVLIPAIALVNGATIAQVEVDEVTYWHVELDSHDVILAENLPAESYLDMGNRAFFAENDVVMLDPALEASPDADPALRTHADYCRPFHLHGPLVDAVRAQMRARALALGWRLSKALDAHLEVDGRRVDPVVRDGAMRFLLPAGATDVWLVSPAVRPCDINGSSDARPLGIDLRALQVDDGFAPPRAIRIDDPRLDAGFSHVEDGHRWTAGRARLPAELWADCTDAFFLRVDLGGDPVARWLAPAISASRVPRDAACA